MKRKLLIFLLALPAFIVAGAWTGVGVAQAAGIHNAAVMTLAGHTSALFLGAIDWVSQISEEACFLAVGAGFVSLALVLHRKSAKRQGE